MLIHTACPWVLSIYSPTKSFCTNSRWLMWDSLRPTFQQVLPHRHHYLIWEIYWSSFWVPRGLHALMASSLTGDHGNTSMSLDLQILQVARPQHIHSHFAICTQVPWHSLTSMVSCLALVNDIHQWPVIQWFLFMLDIDTFIRMFRIVPSGL